MQEPRSNLGSSDPQPAHTPNTLWTVVLEAAANQPERAREALRRLCQLYRRSIVAWMGRISPDAHATEDWASEFVDRFLTRNPLQHFDRREGIRFRAWLKECVRLFALQKRRAMKTDPLRQPGNISLDDEESRVEFPAETSEAAAQCDLDFALDTHDAALAGLGQRYATTAKRDRLEHLCLYIPDVEESPPYREVALRLGLSESAVKKAVFDLRDDYYDAFRDGVKETVPVSNEVDEEMRYLLTLLAGADGVFTWAYVRKRILVTSGANLH